VSDARRTQGGLSVKTLLIAGAASAAAALVIPLVWRPGTVFAAAATPVIVALVTELLRKPVETVSTVRVRRGGRGGVPLDRSPDAAFDPLAPAPTEELDQLSTTIASPPRTEHGRGALTGRRWKLAVATGVIAFAAVAVLFTASELLAGDSVSGDGERTTFFGGSSAKPDAPAPDADQKQEQKREQSTPERTKTPEPEATETPAPTPTATSTPLPEATPPPQATPPPAEPAPAP